METVLCVTLNEKTKKLTSIAGYEYFKIHMDMQTLTTLKNYIYIY